MSNINVLYADMPGTIKAYTINNKDETFTIVLNSRLAQEQHKISYRHELKHIRNGDYEKNIGVGLIEIFAHE